VTDPLAGVLREAWHLYRARVTRMLAVAVAVYGPAVGLIALVTVDHGSTAWCYAAIGLATFLLLAFVAARPRAPRGGDAPGQIALATAVVRAMPVAAVLAAICLVVIGSISILRFWDFLIAIPALYLMFMWVLAVPVVISAPSMPAVIHRVIPTIVAGVGYGPFLAITLTLTYYRLASTHSVAASGPDARPQQVPAA
jgi:hypothetical protein